MSTAITVGDVVHVAEVIGGFVFVIAFFVAIVYILNPFRSGH
jgi:flagellar biogenesis protein FliO